MVTDKIIYTGRHKPSGEDWLILGISKNRNKVCVAGYPPTMAELSDIEHLVEDDFLTEHELEYITNNFGTNWE